MSDAEAALELLGEIYPLIRGIVEVVFILDIHRSGVACVGEYSKKALPIHRAVAWHAEAPPPGSVHRLDARAPQHVRQNFGVLQVHIVDLLDELAGGRHWIHHLPHQVRRIELETYVRAVVESFEQRLPTHRSGGDVRTSR